MKVYVVGSSTGYANWLEGLLVKKMDDADLVLLTGGEDVDPRVYGEPEGKYTDPNYGRDLYEIEKWNDAQKLGLPVIGICRGAQLACALSGGRLVQHMNGTGFIHPMITSEGVTLPTSSLHHQAQFLLDMPEGNAKLLAWATNESPIHWDGENREIRENYTQEVEVAYYPKTRALGIQGHPEMMWRERDKYKVSFDYFKGLLDGLLNNTL